MQLVLFAIGTEANYLVVRMARPELAKGLPRKIIQKFLEAMCHLIYLP